MSKFASSLAVYAAATALLGAAALPASAACTRLGFSVNDYGKEGPTNDAKKLLDGYIAKWAGEHKIAKYNTGPKAVTCELFLNFIVFDEHTCKAEATVCWDGPAVPGTTSAEATDASAPKSVLKKVAAPVLPVNPKAAVAAVPAEPAKSAIETGTLSPPTPVVPAAAPPAAVVATPVPPAAAPLPKPAPVAAVVPPAAPAPAPAPAAQPAPPAAAPAPAVSSAQAIANQALEAAKKAAESAERAAAAAERAAAAATAASKRAAQPAQ